MADELEQGQDDLVKQDKTSENIKRAFRRKRDHIPTDEDIYTDRGARTPSQPAAKQDKTKRPGPFARLKSMWRDAIRDAEIKQQKKRGKKSK